MRIVDYLWILNEFIKCFLIIWGILGYPIRKKGNTKNILGFVLFCTCIYSIISIDKILFQFGVVFAFVILFTDVSLKEKVIAFFIAEISVGMIDLFLGSILIVFVPNIEINTRIQYVDFVFDIFWILLTIVLFRYRKTFYVYISNLRWTWFALLLGVLLGQGVIAGTIQYMATNEMLSEKRNLLLVIQLMVMILTSIGGIIFCYYVITRKNLSLLLEKEKENYLLEKKIYAERLKKNEEIQKFRHDMKKHMKIIYQLCDEITDTDNNAARLRDYVNNYLELYPETNIVYTGNVISDYFISELLMRLNGNSKFKYNIIGKLPEKISITDTDLSILLGNALDNAADELQMIEGECYFEISFKNYKDKLMIKIENTKSKQSVVKFRSDEHGFGIKNMKEVVNRYNGTLEIIETEEMFCVDIFI